MNKLKTAFILAFLMMAQTGLFSQQQDSTQNTMVFSGSLGITNNGFSIVPTFSLNSPAGLILLSWRKNKFSIDPDIRLTADARKGGMLFWLRYYPVEKKKFSLRLGAHPAFNFQIREIEVNGVTSEITQMRRFLAWEASPNYKITPDWSIGIYYLQGNGLQKDGPRTTHFITLNTSISNIKLAKKIRLALAPAVYYLNLDGYEGTYFTATGTISHTRSPFSLQSAINQTFHSNLPGNKDFLWNVSLSYKFSKTYILKKGN